MVYLSSGPRLLPGDELGAVGGMLTVVTQLSEQPTLGFMLLSSGLVEVEEQRT